MISVPYSPEFLHLDVIRRRDNIIKLIALSCLAFIRTLSANVCSVAPSAKRRRRTISAGSHRLYFSPRFLQVSNLLTRR